MLSTGLRRPTSRRFPACFGPVLLSESQSFPTPVSRASKSHNQQAPFFRTLPSSSRHNGARLSASIPCADHVSLAGGSRVRGRRHSCRRRYHCPERGCLVNRSRDCTRSRVPPSFYAGVAITASRRVPFPLSPLRSAPSGLSCRMRSVFQLGFLLQIRVRGLRLAH